MAREKPSFKQQNLPAWQPILTAGTVLPAFFLIGVAFIPIGIGLLMASQTVQESIMDYTDCKNANGEECHKIISNSHNPFPTCKCSKPFIIEKDFYRTVYVYYGLSNFYQNHRRYVRSRDDNQLLGNPKSTNKGCEPFRYKIKGNQSAIPYAPCGAIANSLFNDTFKIFRDNKELGIYKKGIAWVTDKKNRFINPDSPNLENAFENTAKPPNWRLPVWQLDKDKENNGFQNEGLIVWMRNAALPTFRKLYGIVRPPPDNGENNQIQLPRGNYTLEIDYNYPVKMFDGKKRFIISDTSCLGGKNDFLGIAYIVVGSICFVLSAMFLFIHKKYGRLSSEIIQINQQTPYLAST